MAPANEPPSVDHPSTASIAEPSINELKIKEATSKDGCFSLVHGLLYFSEPTDGNIRLCIPSAMTKEVLDIVHSATGHFGICKTYLSASKHYYMSRMSHVIKNYVNNCAFCQSSKPINEKQAGLLHPVQTPDPLHTLSQAYPIPTVSTPS